MSKLLLLLPALVLAGCGAPSADTSVASPQAQPVRVQTAAQAQSIHPLQGSGTVQPEQRLPLSFKVGGLVREVLVNAGDRVRAGQVLARLNDTDTASQLSQARAAFDKAQRDLQRARSLRDQGVIAQQPVDDAQTQVTVTAAALKSAEFNHGHAVITAPVDGVVLSRQAEAGQMLPAGQPVVVLGRNDQHWNLQVGLADRDAVQLARGQAVTVTLDAFPDRPVRGEIKRIGASADVQTGAVPVEVALDTRLPLVAGLVGRARFHSAAPGPASLQLPLTALLEADHAQARVFVIDARDQRARQRTVTLGRLVEDRAEIRAGLAAGERVVVEGAAWLNDGDPVQILR